VGSQKGVRGDKVRVDGIGEEGGDDLSGREVGETGGCGHRVVPPESHYSI
jgi:hypothetical protein